MNHKRTTIFAIGFVFLTLTWAAGQSRSDEPQPVFVQAEHYALLSLAYSIDGKYIAYGGTDPTITIVAAHSGQKLRELRGHTNDVFSLAFSPDNQLLASASVDGTIKLWDWRSGELRHSLEIKGKTTSVFSFAFSPRGDKIADIRSGSLLNVWDVKHGRLLFSKDLDFEYPSSVLFSHDESLIVGGGDENKRGVLETWRGQAMKTRQTLLSEITALSLVSHSDKLLIGTMSGEVTIYDLKRGSIEQTWKAHKANIRGINTSSDGTSFATVVSWETPDVKIWSVSSPAKEINALTNDKDGATSISFSPDNKEIGVLGRDNKIRFWNFKEGRQLRSIDTYSLARTEQGR